MCLCQLGRLRGRHFGDMERFLLAGTFLLIALAIILIGGGLGFTIFATTTQYQALLHSQATTFARQTNVTTLTHATATANAFATANAKIYATATAQTGVTATSITQSTDATATATTLESIFTQATSGTPALTDPLSDNTGNNNWDETSGTVDGSCVFIGGDYHVAEARQGYLQPCIAESTNFSNFAYQVQMIFDKGNQAGIIFRATGSKGTFYFFHIGIDGSYALDLYKSANQVHRAEQRVQFSHHHRLNASEPACRHRRERPTLALRQSAIHYQYH